MLNPLLVGAASLAVIVGAVHSVVGEIVIFAKLRGGGIVPTNGRGVMPSRQLRILWACWHVLTLFGWGLAAILWLLAAEQPGSGLRDTLVRIVAATMLLGAIVIGGGTRWRHPGWVGLLGVAILCWRAIAH